MKLENILFRKIQDEDVDQNFYRRTEILLGHSIIYEDESVWV